MLKTVFAVHGLMSIWGGHYECQRVDILCCHRRSCICHGRSYVSERSLILSECRPYVYLLCLKDRLCAVEAKIYKGW